MVVTHLGGARFAADVRGHRIVVDQPAPTGDDSAPMPIELLGASLGTCVALYVQRYLASRGLPHHGLRVEVAQHGAANPGRVGEFVVRVVLAEPVPAHHAEVLERVARSCPAHNTLAHGAEVDVRLEIPTAAP